MRVYKNVYDRNDFDFWSGACDTAKYLEDKEIELILRELEDMYPDGLSETELNDIFWFEDDWLARIIGYDDFEEVINRNEE